MSTIVVDGNRSEINGLKVLYGGREFSEEEIMNALSFWLGEWSEDADIILSTEGKWEELKSPVPKWFSEVLDWLNKITVLLGK